MEEEAKEEDDHCRAEGASSTQYTIPLVVVDVDCSTALEPPGPVHTTPMMGRA